MMQMKNLIVAFGLVACLAAAGHAAVIIDATTLNGSFETGTDADADGWSPVSGYIEERIANNASDGSWGLVVGHNLDDGSIWGVSQNTGYVVSAGETFDLSFDWIPKYNWRTSDSIAWELFTTSGSIASGSVSGVANGGSYQAEALTGIGTVSAESVGETLSISFVTEIGSGDYTNNQEPPQAFGRIDDVQLSVIPEPATMSLLALGGLAILRRRKA